LNISCNYFFIQAEESIESDEEDITEKPFDGPGFIKSNEVAPFPFASVGPRKTKYPEQIFVAANTVTAAVKIKRKKHKKKKEKLYNIEKELRRRESEIEIKEAKIKEKQAALSKREANLLMSAATKWSGYSQRKVQNFEGELLTTNPALKFYQNYKRQKAAKYQPELEPQPHEFVYEVPREESTIVLKPQRRISLQSLATAVSAIAPTKSKTVSIDISNEDGEFIDSKIHGSNC